jgi:NAD(P)-dependent dehydrogenase (short-subunit alcohol dehydrogenase family)
VFVSKVPVTVPSFLLLDQRAGPLSIAYQPNAPTNIRVSGAVAHADILRMGATIGTNLMQNPVVPYHDYTAAKGALLALTRTAAKELWPLGVTVNMVSGGLLRTTDASAATPECVFDIVASQTPMGHVTTPDEMADAVLFFAASWSRAVTGQNLIVDGGLVFG